MQVRINNQPGHVSSIMKPINTNLINSNDITTNNDRMEEDPIHEN